MSRSALASLLLATSSAGDRSTGAGLISRAKVRDPSTGAGLISRAGVRDRWTGAGLISNAGVRDRSNGDGLVSNAGVRDRSNDDGLVSTAGVRDRSSSAGLVSNAGVKLLDCTKLRTGDSLVTGVQIGVISSWDVVSESADWKYIESSRVCIPETETLVDKMFEISTELGVHKPPFDTLSAAFFASSLPSYHMILVSFGRLLTIRRFFDQYLSGDCINIFPSWFVFLISLY